MQSSCDLFQPPDWPFLKKYFAVKARKMKNAFSLQGCVATRSLATLSVKI